MLAISLIKPALSNNPKFIKFNADSGLSSDIIYDIQKDKSGHLWLATANGLVSYNGYDFKVYTQEIQKATGIFAKDIRVIKQDSKGSLWVGTNGSGLISKHNDYYKSYLPHSKVIKDITITDNATWIISENGIYQKSNNNNQFRQVLPSSDSDYVSISNALESKVLIASNSELLILHEDASIHSKFNLNSLNLSPIKIRKSKFYDSKNIMLATHNGLKLFNIEDKSISDFAGVLDDTIILDFEYHDKELWVSSFKNGVYIFKDNHVLNYRHIKDDPTSISDNVVLSLYITDEYKWLGTFSGLNLINYNHWVIENHSIGSIPLQCLGSNDVSSIYQSDNFLYLSSRNKFIRVNLKNNQCQNLLPLIPTIENTTFMIFDYLQEGSDIFLSTQNGVFQLTESPLSIKPIYSDLTDNRVYTTKKITNDLFLIGTTRGAFYYDKTSKNIKRITFTGIEEDIFIYDIYQVENSYLLATNKGVFKLESGSLTAQSFVNEFSDPAFSLTLFKSKVYIATVNSKVLVTDLKGVKIKDIIVQSDTDISASKVFSPSSSDSVWLTSAKGLFKLDSKLNSHKHFSSIDGFQGNYYYRDAFQETNDGKILLGGKKGFNVFYPEDIKDNLVPPKVALTKLTRFNKEVVPGEDYEGFGIDKPIEYLEELEIGHRDYVMGFEFAGLHYADPMRNQYQFMLEGFHEDWVSTDAKNRNATFTNLSPGDYVFRVKAANKDGVWSLDEDNVALKITVHPAPWLSWWAFLIYGLMILGSILWFIRYRTKSAIARSKELEQEVSVRTKEIETQKNVIESLLERKNELFANISHEFRTPLTLILGPLEKELKALDSPKNPKHLQMIQRNATRLLGMVEQILKLTELKKEETVNKVPHAVNPALEAIVESFSSLAESKQIELTLDVDKSANVMAANDALEVMVGNLVSNAIKYTPEQGKVLVTSKLLENKIQISVTDTGVGMTAEQQEDVFERFVRLDKTSDIAGTGIGLSIVKELILAHNGQVSVDSIEGQGSTFIITLPTTDQAALSDTLSIKSIEHLTQGETTVSEVTQATEEALTDTQQELVLIIDDNPDMRDYIQEVLSPNYHCITADRGEPGIELAKAQVPDLIICDIMMPGIDGYEVAKHLRDDIITSHIPLVLLTAKGDKESRIQGWNENIDDYMTKPFDEEELKARISNILALRTLIKDSQSRERKHNKERENILSDKDKAFIEKLNSVFEKYYQNPLCTRSMLASDMAVSERQLQRKLKGLINQNPMDYLRNYRLDKGAELISTGKPINLISDLCGFNSASHFSQCFKAKFGVTPKNYQ